MRTQYPIKKNKNISKAVLFNIPFLKTLTNGRKDVSVANEATNSELLALVEIAFNIIKSRVPLRRSVRKKLLQNAETIRALARAKTPSATRKILSAQAGRGLPALAGVIASAVIPLLTSIINSE